MRKPYGFLIKIENNFIIFTVHKIRTITRIMTHFLIDKSMIVLQDADPEAPFLIQIQKHAVQQAVLTFVDRGSNELIDIPTGAVVYEVDAASGRRHAAYNMPNRPYFAVRTTESYEVDWNGRTIFRLTALRGWALS